MQTLVIAEKPSVATLLVKVIGAVNKKEGYYVGNGYKVSWCIGHLVKMANPESYDKKYAKWNIKDLPIIPNNYKYEVSKTTVKQFNILKKLMNDKDIENVINACDAGREGESIFRLLYIKVGCKKKVKRLWISSMEDSAIKEGFNRLKNGSDYDNLFYSATSRAIADWLVGMNISRLYSILHKKNYSVGRVQTPTLAMIAERDEKIKNFMKEKYYTVDIKTKDFIISTDRIDSLEEAKRLNDLLPKEIVINEVIKEEKIIKPDKLYNLTTLQREANKIYGYSAKQTLDYAQSLYEKKMLTYPRTDSRYLTEDMKDTVKALLTGLEPDFRLNNENYNLIFKNEKVSDHYAIIPTGNSLRKNPSEIPESERKIYELVVFKLLMACSDDLTESITKISYKIEKYEFSANGKVIINQGFTKYLKELNNKKTYSNLHDIKENDKFEVIGSEVKEKYTKPPKYFTEDSLLKAMETAGNDSLDKNIEVEKKGLGTPATRAGIIENLIYKGYVVRDKKNLIITKKGTELINIVSDIFKSPDTTAKWEMSLAKIADGRISKEEFLEEIASNIRQTINQYKRD